MTQRLNHLSRRHMFSLTAGGASALALGGMLGGGSRIAQAAGAKPQLVSESQLPAGSLIVPGDLKLTPEMAALAEKLLARSKHAVLTAATRPGEAKDDKVVAAAGRLVGELRSKRVTRLQSKLKLPEAHGLGEYVKAQPKLMRSGYKAELVKVVDNEKVKIKIKREKKEPAKPQFNGPLAKKIEFQLNSVKCVRETSGESGSDEILLGGQIITPGGVIKKIDRFKVSDDFDEGEVRWYDYSRCGPVARKNLPSFMEMLCPNGDSNDVYGGRKLAATNLGVDLPWPATIGLVLIMGEEDPGGGFGKLLEDVYGALDEELKKQLDDLGKETGAALGGAFGEAIGAALAYVVGEFIDWLVNLFDNPDDPIAAKSWTVQLGSPEMSAIRGMSNEPLPSPGGTWAAPMKKLKFNGDGGKYEARLHWRVKT